MNGLQITKETYLQASDKLKDEIMFDLMKHNYACMDEVKAALRKKKKVDFITSGISGFFGGMVAVLGRSMWK